MARCTHGMDRRFCALCNGACLKRDDSHPHARPDDEPRFAKGRDSAEWKGIGQFMPTSGHPGLKACAREGSLRMRPSPRSWWSKVTMREGVNTAQPEPLTPAQLLVLARVSVPRT